MKLVLAVEGGDGTGKSTIALHMKEFCRAQGLTTKTIGRMSNDAGETIGNFTDLIRSATSAQGDDHLSSFADMYLRLAREFQRAHQVAICSADVVLLDRFVLSDMARARTNDVNTPCVSQALTDIMKIVALNGTFFCDCPFDVAWPRVTSRPNLSPKELLGEDYNRQLFEIMKEVFQEGTLTGTPYRLDTTAGLDQCRQDVDRILSSLINEQI